jgi:hypothetical protein
MEESHHHFRMIKIGLETILGPCGGLTTWGHLDGFNQDDFGAHGGFTHVPLLKPFSR